MKKTLLTIFSGVLLAGTASAQCTPDPQYANASGNFFPDSLDFVTNDFATAGVDYEAVIDIKTIADTLVDNPVNPAQQITAYIDAFKVVGVSGAPAGFSFTGGGPTFETADPTGGTEVDSTWWNTYGTPGDATTIETVQGCLQITAAAADVDAAAPTNGDPFVDYAATVSVDARIAGTDPDIGFLVPPGTWLSDLGSLGLGPLSVDDYVLRVYGPTGIMDVLNPNVFEVHQSYPNPAGDEATITFTTPRMENIEVKVFNMLGAVVYNQNIVSESGVNDIKLNTGRMSSGLYVYTVSNGTKTFTKKMTVK